MDVGAAYRNTLTARQTPTAPCFSLARLARRSLGMSVGEPKSSTRASLQAPCTRQYEALWLQRRQTSHMRLRICPLWMIRRTWRRSWIWCAGAAMQRSAKMNYCASRMNICAASTIRTTTLKCLLQASTKRRQGQTVELG